MIDTKRLAADAAYWDEVAPEGATHYDQDCPCPWLKESPASYFRIDGNWREYSNMDTAIDHILGAIPRPTRPAEQDWDSEGLPPVGSTQRDCKLVGIHGDVKQFEIVAHRNGAAIVYVPLGDNDSDAFPALPCHFRPIRTKEQREREDWINRASKAAGFPECPATRKVCADIYDGLIKIKGL